MPHITAIGAHPDDIEIFMYGLMAACHARGDRVSLLVATDGAAGHDAAGGATAADLAKKRADECQQALAALGKPVMLGLPDGGLADSRTAFATIRQALTKTTADLVVTHDPHDYHPDHRALAKLVTDAMGFRCPVVYADTLLGVGFTPQYYIDITAYMADKEAAILAHKSQEPQRFAEATRLHNRFRAAQMNAPDGHYAECYRSNGRFPFADIRALLPAAPPLRPFYIVGGDGLI